MSKVEAYRTGTVLYGTCDTVAHSINCTVQ